jgi:hypothetical protein
MRRKILIVLLSLGTIGGYAAGFAGLGCPQRREARREAFEHHIARVCLDAARDPHPPGPPPGR